MLSILELYFKIIAKYSLYATIILTLLLILAKIIIFIGKTYKISKFKKAFIEHKIHNSKNEIPIIESEEKLDNNSTHYVVENMGIGIDKFSCKTTDMEAIVDEKILYIINHPKTSKKLLIKTQSWESFNNIKEIELKNDDLEDNLVFIDNMVAIGATGEGKTTFIKFWLGKVCFYYNERNFDNLEIFILDHKNGNDFSFLKNKDNYYTGDNVYSGIDFIYNEFIKRRDDIEYRKNCKRLVVFIDEFSTLLTLMPKKTAEELKPKLFALISEGREMNITMVYGMQRCDAKFFEGARTNLKVRVGLRYTR